MSSVANALEWTARPQRMVLSVATFLLFLIGGRGGGLTPGLDLTVVIGMVAAVNLGSNAIAVRGVDPFRNVPRCVDLQIAVDLILALAAIMVIDAQSSPLAWMLLLVPVVDAATSYGTKGALVAWVAVSLLYMVIVLTLRPDESTSRELVQTGLQQSAAIIAVTISVTAITARVRGHLEATDSARLRAESKKHELWIVSRAARQMGSAEQQSQDVFTTAVDAALALGFDRADLCEQIDGEWRLMSSAGDPSASLPGDDQLLATALTMTSVSSVGVSTSGATDRQELHDLGYEQAAAFVTGSSDEQMIAIRGYRHVAAADDSSAWEAMETLVAQTGVALGNARSRASLAEWAEQLDHRANHDELTGLPNRAYLLANLDVSPPAATAVMFLDLDGFKQVNDSLGHDAGDRVLEVVAERLESILLDGEFVARLGGDEFVVASYRRDDAAVEALAQAVIDEVLVPIRVGDVEVEVGTSIGIARPDGEDIAELLRRADTAMYEAKVEGRRLGLPVYQFAGAEPAVAVAAAN